jgi:hypothetical protein
MLIQVGGLTRQALQLWIGARSLRDDWRIFGPQVLNTPFHLPPILRYQLETIIQLQILEPLRKQLLSELQKVILKDGNWSTLLLTMFILLITATLN